MKAGNFVNRPIFYGNNNNEASIFQLLFSLSGINLTYTEVNLMNLGVSSCHAARATYYRSCMVSQPGAIAILEIFQTPVSVLMRVLIMGLKSVWCGGTP
jgi:hypothetical protein